MLREKNNVEKKNPKNRQKDLLTTISTVSFGNFRFHAISKAA